MSPQSVIIHPRHLSGTVRVPSSKSQGHRLLLAAALAEGESTLSAFAPSQDMDATLRCVEELGAEWSLSGDTLTLRGSAPSPAGQSLRRAYPHFDCGESGSTLRFLIPLALAVRGGGYFTGRGRLMERPLTPYFDLFDKKGIFWEKQGDTLFVQGALSGGDFALPGDVSSQFITGLLYALPLLSTPSTLTLTTPLESAGYIEMTLQALRTASIQVEKPSEKVYKIPGNQRFLPFTAQIEPDWSQAAFWYAALRLSHFLDIPGLNGASAQGDKIITDFFLQLCGAGEVTLDVSNCPDLVPPLAAMAAFRPGETTRIVGAARLRIKESDRLSAVHDVLTALGADVTEGADSLTLVGRDRLEGGTTVDSHNDHRIAMMTAIAATRCRQPVTLKNPMCVEKSYPAFWRDYENLGGKLQWNM